MHEHAVPKVAVAVRPAHAVDVGRLGLRLPAETPWEHEQRLLDQSAGSVSYLVAEGEAEGLLGHVLVDWRGSRHEHVRSRLGVTPELRRLVVHAEARRRGIGGLLVRHVEALAIERAVRRLGLAVAVENGSARRLYASLGYEDWDGGTFDSGWRVLAGDGQPSVFTHHVTYMTRECTTVTTRRAA